MDKVCRGLGIAVILIGLILGITSCVGSRAADGFMMGALSALAIWFIAAVVGTILLALSDVLERLSSLESADHEIHYAIANLHEETNAVKNQLDGNEKPAPQPPPVARRIAQRPDTWTCKKCHAVNQRTDLSCRDCGAYR